MAELVEKKRGGCRKLAAVLLVILGGLVAFAAAFLVALAGYSVRSTIENKKLGSATGDLGAFNSALNLYHNDVSDSTYPADLRQLLADNRAGWSGPYMATISPDPWGNQYSYQSDGHDYTLLSIHEAFFYRTRTETVRYILSEGKVSLLP